MRILTILPLVLISACTAQDAPNNAVAGNGATAEAATPVSTVPGDEPASSANAKQAKMVVEQYYALIAAKKYAAARLLWDDEGAASGGDVAAFTATITPYSVYQPKVGEPTEIKAVDGKQFIKVPAELHVKRRSNGAEADRVGAVMLRRPFDAKQDPTKVPWRIWGVDVRVQH